VKHFLSHSSQCMFALAETGRLACRDERGTSALSSGSVETLDETPPVGVY